MKTTVFFKSVQRVMFVTLCTAALGALPVIAQDAPATPQGQAGPPPQGRHGDPAEREQHQIEFLTKKLNLTPDQVTQVKAIDDDARTQAMAVHNDTSIPQSDKRAKMMSIHQASQDKIRALLNDDQKAKYAAIQAKQQERWQNHEGGTPPPSSQPQ
jgi:protein CpxP